MYAGNSSEHYNENDKKIVVESIAKVINNRLDIKKSDRGGSLLNLTEFSLRATRETKLGIVGGSVFDPMDPTIRTEAMKEAGETLARIMMEMIGQHGLLKSSFWKRLKFLFAPERILGLDEEINR